jgi:hypothetical protein
MLYVIVRSEKWRLVEGKRRESNVSARLYKNAKCF